MQLNDTATDRTRAEALDDAADEAAEFLKALANRTRLMILCHLVQGERSVGELASLLGRREAAVSQQLALLRRDGLVRNRKRGQTVFYRLGDPAVARVIGVLYDVFCADTGR